MQRPRRSRRQTRTTPGGEAQPTRRPPAPRPTAPARKLLREMTPQERADWYAGQAADLEEFCSFAQRWTKNRKRNDHQTRTDERYYQFFDQAADLIAGLTELAQEEASQDNQEEEQKHL